MNQQTQEDKIVNRISAIMWVPIQDIMGRGRTKQVALARQIAMYFVNRAGSGVERTGRYFDRHHSNVSYATKHIHDLRFCDEEVRMIIEQIETAMPEIINSEQDYQI